MNIPQLTETDRRGTEMSGVTALRPDEHSTTNKQIGEGQK